MVQVLKERQIQVTRIARAGLSLALMVFIFQQIDLSQFTGLIKGAKLSYLVIAAGLVIADLVLGAYRWQKLLAGLDISLPLPKLTESYFVGLFFNNFLPTSMGGDVVRVYDVAKHSQRPSASAASVIAERALSALAQGLIALFGLALGYDLAQRFSTEIVMLFALLCLLLLGLLLAARWTRRFTREGASSLRKKLTEVLGSIDFCLQDRRLALRIILLSLLFHGLIVLINHMIFQALGAEISLLSCFLVVPVILFITLLPISINGLGVREGAYVYFFGRLGLSMTTSVAASLLYFLLLTLVSLVGGVLFALRS